MLYGAPGCLIPRRMIRFITSYQTYAVKNYVQKQREAGKVFNYCGNNKINTAIILKGGTVILVRTSVSTLEARWNKRK